MLWGNKCIGIIIAGDTSRYVYKKQHTLSTERTNHEFSGYD